MAAKTASDASDAFEPRAVLRRCFGYDSFRPNQEQIVDALLDGRDVLAVMPTGAGKSVCYQVPALCLAERAKAQGQVGFSLVVSPLISLMADQARSLNAAGISAAFVNSSLSSAEQNAALQGVAQGAYVLLYVAPERLEIPQFARFCAACPPAMVAVDEAHCISQWGQDFRPSYTHISAFVESLPVRPVLCAFTATATEAVRADIAHALDLRDPLRVTASFDRPNLHFAVRRAASRGAKGKDAHLMNICREHAGQSGIVYCTSRRAVEQVCDKLQDEGFSATRYHAGLTPEERAANQDDFVYDRVQIIVATNAFGMGIDKSNVSFVVHYNMPLDLESYYQEAGRAGRDGEPARCILLYSGTDVRTIRFFIDKEREADNGLPADVKAEAARKAEERLKYMTFYSTTPRCLRGFMLQYFGEAAPAKCGNCSNCLMAEEAARQMEQRAAEAKQRAAASTRRLAEKPRRRPADVELSAEDEKLLADLYALRKRLASKQKIPAYLVFSDATLREMVQKKPFSTDELLNITGVGEKKAARYGTIFLAAIEEAVSSR